MHAFDLFRCEALQDKQFVVALVELCATFAGRVDLQWLGPGQGFPVINVVNVEAFAQITEHQRAVFFYFEVGGHVLLVEQVIVHLDLGEGPKVVRQEHHRYVDMTQLVYL